MAGDVGVREVVSLGLVADRIANVHFRAMIALGYTRQYATRPAGTPVDRIFLAEVAKTDSRVASELVTPFYVDGVFPPSISLHGYGENAFPLESLIRADNERKAEDILLGSSPIYQRLRVAARWHAKAHWAFDTTDAVLALGISFDALLSEKGPTPGRAIAERFALLDPNPEVRLSTVPAIPDRVLPS